MHIENALPQEGLVNNETNAEGEKEASAHFTLLSRLFGVKWGHTKEERP